MKSAEAAPTPIRSGPRGVPSPCVPWHQAQSCWYRVRPVVACGAMGWAVTDAEGLAVGLWAWPIERPAASRAMVQSNVIVAGPRTVPSRWSCRLRCLMSAPSSAQGEQKRRDVSRLGLADAEVRHVGPGLHPLGMHDPADEVRPVVGEFAGDVPTVG